MSSEVSALIAERDQIENEIMELVAFLTAPDMPGLKGSLVDSEGFPLPNMDLYRVREARQRYNRLNNDYTDIMNKIEHSIHALHSQASEEEVHSTSERAVADPIAVSIEKPQHLPFARISEVTEGSPASTAEIRPEDRVVAFGPINHSNHSELRALGPFVRESENQDVAVVVLRKNAVNQDQLFTLTVRPQTWHGQGLLGCRFLPIS